MNEIDKFSRELLEQAKRFLEKAEEEKAPEAKRAYANAALMLGFASLEAYINSISDELLLKQGLPLLDQSVLQEREILLDKGRFILSNTRKYRKLEERIEFLYVRHTGKRLNKSATWWGELQAGINLRNSLTHPRKVPDLKPRNIRNAIEAIVQTLDVLFRAVYKKEFPAVKSGTDSNLQF